MSWESGEPDLFEPSLTGDFADSQAVADIKQADAMALYVDYTKGDEDGIELRLSFRPEGAPADDYYQDSRLNMGDGVVTSITYLLSETAKIRIPDPVLIQEDKLLVEVRGLPAGPALTYSGTVTLRHRTNNQYWRGCQS